jgi:hypothetical protein
MKRPFLTTVLMLSAAIAFGARTRIVPNPKPASPPAETAPAGGKQQEEPARREAVESPRLQKGQSSPFSPAAGPRTRIVPNAFPAAGTPARPHPTAIVPDDDLTRNIRRQQRLEALPGRRYQHRFQGRRYVHYYDNRLHWYGFPHGADLYWTAWHGDRWWWFDQRYGRWSYWSDGFWRWPSPTGNVYVYINDDYRPYEDVARGPASTPQGSPPPVTTPPAKEGGEWKSPDKKRMVQVAGPRAEAFLYDLSSGAEPVFMKYLGRNIQKVRFSGGTDQKPLRILLDQEDGSFALYTRDGDLMDTNP